jgi:uncharacterized protein (TIGR00299 family) protein
MGAAGDMLMAALMELCPDPDSFIAQMNTIGLKDTVITANKCKKQGITGHQISVVLKGNLEEETADLHDHHDADDHHHDDRTHHHHDTNGHHHDHDDRTHDHHDHDDHVHSGLDHILDQIDSLDIPKRVKEKAGLVYALLAEAEAHVHECPIGDIHFHEVGTLDAIADIVGCCLALDLIAPDRIVVSPVHVGAGQVRCQHGVLPVPAPATAHLLRTAPIYGGTVMGELCTPTGAALLQAFANSYGPMPVMAVSTIGYGMGKKDFDRLNCLRAFLGNESREEAPVYELTCNLDDITAEELAFACDMIFTSGALDVYAVPIVMKKGRAGHLLTALAKADDKDAVATALLTHTTTRGIRISSCERMTMSYRHEPVDTVYGTIDVKISSGYGISKVKPEYDQVATAAKAHQVSFAEVSHEALSKLGDRS